MLQFIVIGITDNPNPYFPPDVLDIIRNGRVFSGGRRHHEIVAPLLPPNACWIDITAPLDGVFEQYHIQCSVFSVQCVTVFASRDPLFFGFANTIRRKMPEAAVVVYPSFNSLQMLAHRLLMPYHDMRIVSLTGRPWQEFDRALIEQSAKIGVLTDKEHTPAAIALRMLDYGYTYYNMYVGEHLGNPSKEKVTALSLEEAAQREFTMPNCFILNTDNHKLSTNIPQTTNNDSWGINDSLRVNKNFGLPDSSFALLDGREKMITKMPIRLLTLQALDLPHRHVFWDIGACTGSVSIEARLLFPHLRVVAFEIRPECEAIICENARRHGAPGIEVVVGDFCSVCCNNIATNGAPDAVFIGGHGGRLKDIMAKVLTMLAPGGIIVMNSVVAPKVTRDSRQLWDDACRELGLKQEPPLHIQLNDNHPITILKCRR